MGIAQTSLIIFGQKSLRCGDFAEPRERVDPSKRWLEGLRKDIAHDRLG